MQGKLFLGLLVALLSPSAVALTSICSSELVDGMSTVKHEALWSYHDNWFFNMYVEVSTAVTGPVSPAVQETVEMRVGGDIEHQLANAPAGQYRIHGSVRVGYPAAWGFDDLIDLECPAWTGEVSATAETKERGDDSKVPAGGGFTTSAPACGEDAAESMCQAPVPEDVGGPGATDTDPRVGDASRTLIVTGLVDLLEGDQLVVRTMVNRYVNMQLASGLSVRHSASATLADLQVGDVIGLQHGRAFNGSKQLQRLTVYRGTAVPPLTRVDTDQPAALELRSVVQGVDERGGKALLRLAPAQGELILDTGRDTALTIVRNASTAELEPYATVVRVRSVRQADGTLLATHIDILK